MSSVVSMDAVKKFLQDQKFVKVTKFASTIKKKKQKIKTRKIITNVSSSKSIGIASAILEKSIKMPGAFIIHEEY